MKHNEYCLTTGEFAKMCQTTRDTLRYYEKHGILIPHKNEENGYHYYSYAQISSYYFIQTFRSLDCSVEDIKKYLLAGEEIHFDQFVEKQYTALLQMKNALDQKIGIIANARKLLKQIKINDIGKPTLYTFPEKVLLKLTPIYSSPATSSGEIAEDIRRHMKECDRPHIQMFPMGASISAANFLEGNYTYKNVFSFADPESEANDLTVLPCRTAVVAVCTENDGDIRKTYKDIVSYIEKEKKKLCTDVYSLSIVNVLNPQEKRKYLKYIFACIQ